MIDGQRTLGGIGNCQAFVSGDCMKYLEKTYEVDHLVYHTGKGSSIFNLIWLPLLLLKGNVDTGDGTIDCSQMSNEEAMSLMLDINLSSDHFGSLAEGRIDDETGPVIVVRADGGHLVREHIETCCQYVKQEVEPNLQAADTLTKRENALKDITKADFLRFASRYQLKMAGHGGCQGCDRRDCSGTAEAWLRTVCSPWLAAGSMWISHRLGLDRREEDDLWAEVADGGVRRRAKEFLSALPPGV